MDKQSAADSFDLSLIQLIQLPSNKDDRGVLTSIESLIDIPIEIKRIFYMHDVISDRGGHAHIETDQVVICVAGSFSIGLTTPQFDRTDFEMNSPVRGLYIPRMTFIDITNITSDCVCLVLANTHYDMKKSLRSWDQYLEYLKHHGDLVV